MSRQTKRRRIKREAMKLLDTLLRTRRSDDDVKPNARNHQDNIYHNGNTNSQIHLECGEFNFNSINYVNEGPNITITKQQETLQEFLASWSIRHAISTKAANELLNRLTLKGHDLPFDVRTLRGTPRYTNIVNMDVGSYFHYGLKNCLTDFIFKNYNNLMITGTEHLKLNFGVDGMQLFSSSKRTAWPILMNVSSFPCVHLVGCYLNVSSNEILSKITKPQGSDLFMERFVSELRELMGEGLLFNNKIFTIDIGVFVCDAPARAFLLNVKSHSGFNCCTKCTHAGSYYKHRITFPPKETNLRSGKSFANRSHRNHHKTLSKLQIETLNMDCVKQFPIDYMHCVCLGVTKQLLKLWTKKKGEKYSLSQEKNR